MCDELHDTQYTILPSETSGWTFQGPTQWLRRQVFPGAEPLTGDMPGIASNAHVHVMPTLDFIASFTGSHARTGKQQNMRTFCHQGSCGTPACIASCTSSHARLGKQQT